MSDTSVHRGNASDQDWVRPPGFPRRLDIRVTRAPEPRDGFRIYAPQRRIALLRYRLGRLPVVRLCARRQSPPPWQYEQFAELAGIVANAAIAMRSSATGRWIIGLERGDALIAVVKCGPPLDSGLRWEAQLLAELNALEVRDPWVQVPQLLAANELDGCFAVVTKATPRRVGRASLDEIGQLATRLTNGALGTPLVHGDLAQWNIIRTDDHVWLLDWEHSRRERLPLWDLANHLVGEGILVGRYTPHEVAQHLVAEGSVGWNHLSEVHEDPRGAREFALGYLNTRPPLDRSAEQFDRHLRRYLE